MNNTWINGNYYKQHPTHILGEAYQTSGRFGKVTKYKGTIDLISRIPAVDYQVSDMLNISTTIQKTSIQDVQMNPTQQIHIENALAIADQEQQNRINSRSSDTLDLISFDEVDAEYNKHLSSDQIKAFVWYMRFELKRPMNGGWKKYYVDYNYISTKKWIDEGVVCLDEGVLVPAFIYFSGNLYEKREWLSEMQAEVISRIGQKAYDNQLQGLEQRLVQLQRKRLLLAPPKGEEKRQLRILPTSEFARTFQITQLKDAVKMKERLSKRKADYGNPDYFNTKASDYQKKEIKTVDLQGAFMLWMKNNRSIVYKKSMDYVTIAKYYLQDKPYVEKTDGNRTKFRKIKSAAKTEGKRLFQLFLATEIEESDQKRIEDHWNEGYNGFLPIDLNQVPIGFSMARYYNGMEMDIRPEKREAIAFAIMSGSGCLAYGVGLGKTWASIFTMAQFIENGWCERPFLTLPNQVYNQFKKEIEGILPQYPINDFYNLSKDYESKVEFTTYNTYKQREKGSKITDAYDILQAEYDRIFEKYNIQIEEGDKEFEWTDQEGNEFITYITPTVRKKAGGQVAAQSITLFSYEGFRRLGLTDSGESSFYVNLFKILEQKKGEDETLYNKRDREAFNKKLEGIIGKASSGSYVSIEDLGLDFMIVDEAHAAKKIFTNVAAQPVVALGKEKKARKEYKISAGAPSTMGLKTFMVAQYIQSRRETGNVLLLTATPFTNSPLEVFSMLALVAYNQLDQMRLGNSGYALSNITEFFDNFAEIKNELVITAALKPVFKEVFTGFVNLPGLQGILRKFFLYKQSTANQKRPNKIVLPLREKMVDGALVQLLESEMVDSILPMSPEQQEYMTDVLQYAAGGPSLYKKTDDGIECPTDSIEAAELEEDDDQLQQALKDKSDDVGEVSIEQLGSKDKDTARLLVAVNLARDISLSPFLYVCNQLERNPTPKRYVETSNKLHFVMQCIASVKRYHERNDEPVSGQIIYMNRGIKYFPLLVKYLIEEVGYNPSEVGVIASESVMKKMGYGTKSDVQDRFLGRRLNPETRQYEIIPDEYRIKVLIGSATIKEGINLQNRATVLYNCFLDWNPTDVVQLEGRIWRQGNWYENVLIVNPLMEDSMDIFMFQKLEEKTKRINAIWDYDNNESSLDLSDFNPSELKYQLIKDPYRVAEIEGLEQQEFIKDDIQLAERIKERIDEYKGLQNSLSYFSDSFQEFVSYYRPDFENYTDYGKLLSEIKSIIRKQQLPDGRDAIELEHESVAKYEYGSYQANPYRNYNLERGIISYPYRYKDFVQTWRKYKTLVEFLKERNIQNSEEGVATAKEVIAKEIEDLKERIKFLESDNYKEERAQQIQAEREKTGYKSADIAYRMQQFETLLPLLSDRKLIPKIDAPKGQIFYKVNEHAKYKGKKAKILKVISRSGETMYRVQVGKERELVFQNELTPTTKAQSKRIEVDIPPNVQAAKLLKLKVLKAKVAIATAKANQNLIRLRQQMQTAAA